MTFKKISFIMPFHILEGRGGGAEVQAWLLAKELARRGFEVDYIAQSVADRENTIDHWDGVTIRWLPHVKRFDWLSTRDYYQSLKESNPDLVIQRMTSYHTGTAGYYCRKHNKKFAWICTDNASPVRWLFLKKQLKVNSEVKPGLLKRIVFIANALIYDLFRQYGVKRVDYPFTQNDQQQLMMQNSFKLESSRMISGHEPPETLIPADKLLLNKYILWVANLAPRKRPEIFIEMARLASETDFRFIMVGGRADQEYIDRLFKDKPANLEWVGKLPFDEALGWFDRALFFVNTSTKDGEGFPNTYIQAWLRGAPVLSAGVDPDNIIEKNKLGWVAEEPEKLLEAIKNLTEHQGEYKEISKKAVEYANRHHSVQAMTDNFLKAVGGS